MKEKIGVVYFIVYALVFLWVLVKFWGELEGYRILLIACITFFIYGIYENVSKLNKK